MCVMKVVFISGHLMKLKHQLWKTFKNLETLENILLMSMAMILVALSKFTNMSHRIHSFVSVNILWNFCTASILLQLNILNRMTWEWWFRVQRKEGEGGSQKCHKLLLRFVKSIRIWMIKLMKRKSLRRMEKQKERLSRKEIRNVIPRRPRRMECKITLLILNKFKD